MTNEHGKKFLESYFKGREILGVEVTESNKGRREFTMLYVSVNKDWNTGKVKGKEVCAAILPDKDTRDDGTCFFGNLRHFAMCYAEDLSGVRLRLQNNGHLMWPVWYTEREDFLRWKSFYDEMMQKYAI